MPRKTIKKSFCFPIAKSSNKGGILRTFNTANLTVNIQYYEVPGYEFGDDERYIIDFDGIEYEGVNIFPILQHFDVLDDIYAAAEVFIADTIAESEPEEPAYLDYEEVEND